MNENDFVTVNHPEEVLIETQEEQVVAHEEIINITTKGIDAHTATIAETDVVNISVGEVSDASFGTRVVVNHNASDPNQHTISAITGLREELNEIERLKALYSDGFNVANYYQWESGTYNTHGYFVSIVDGDKIRICNDTDIFGVVVDTAGFVGNQSTTERDNSYGLVVTSGLVDVRCELNVNSGDYVVSNGNGYATKAQSNYGYKVLCTEDKQGVKYAVIALGVQADTTNKLGTNVAQINNRLGAAETNIISAVNVAQQAYNKAANAEISNQTMSEQVNNTLGTVGKLESDMESFGAQISSSAQIAAQAKAIAESVVTSAESMKNEAVEKANEALADMSDLRREFEELSGNMSSNLSNEISKLQESQKGLEEIAGNLSDALDQAVQDFENADKDFKDFSDNIQGDLKDVSDRIDELVDDIAPLVTWPEGATGDAIKGVAGFVKQASDDSILLGTIARWKGDTGDSLVGYIQEVGEGYATTEQIAKVGETVAAVKTIAEENKGLIEAITGVDGSLAGLRSQVDANSAAVTTLASHIIGDYVSVDSWSDTDKDQDAIYYDENTGYYWYYDTEWKYTDKSYETKPPLSGALAGIQQAADANKASIEMITGIEGEFGKAITAFAQEATKENATLKAIANYQQKDADGNVVSDGAAGLISQVDANKSAIDLLVNIDGDGYAGLAGLTAQVDANKSSVATLASHIVGEFENTDDWVADKKDTTKIYYAKNNKLYYYYDNKNSEWKSTDKAYEAGLNGALAGTQQIADANTASIESIVAWQGETDSSIAAVKQTADQNSADILLTASWKSEVENDVASIAGIKATADANAATISQLTQKDTELNTTIAGVKTTADANKASIEQITEWKSNVDPTISSVAGIKQTADGNAASITGLTAWQGDTNIAMARIEQKADANGAYIQSTVSNMDKYSVGPHSQAYGFTLEQAASVLEEGMIYVPTVSVTEQYEYTDDDEVVQKYERNFAPQYLYKWGKVNGQYRWITVDKNYVETTETNTSSQAVYFTTTKPAVSGNFGYWYTNGSSVTSGYNPYTLYKWETYKDEGGETQYHWVPVATLAGNSQSRAVSQIRQDANSIELSVATMDGKYAGTKAWVDANSADIQNTVAWKNSNAESITTFMQTAGDNFASASQVAKIVDKDGNVNEASIVTAVNNNASSIYLSADNIMIDGTTSFKGKVENIESNATYDTKVEYALSSSLTEFTAVDGDSGQWSTTAPSWQANAYMWQRTTITKGDGTEVSSDPTCIHGANGNSVRQITQDVKSYTYSEIMKWVGDDDGWWDNITISDFNPGDTCFVAIHVTDRGNAVGYMRCEITDYDPNNNGGTLNTKCLDFMMGPTGSEGKSVRQITRDIIEYTYTQLMGWVGRENDPWTGITISHFNPGDTCFIPVCVTDRDNAIGYMRCEITGYDKEKGILYANNLDFMMGPTGATGRGTTGVTNYYYATETDTETLPTAGDAAWKTQVSQLENAFSTTYKYLWNYEVVAYSDGSSDDPTDPTIIGIYSADGKGIDSIIEYYITTATSTPPDNYPTANNANGWTRDDESTTLPQTSASAPYLWNYEIINYTKGEDSTSGPVCIGTYGNSIKTTTEYYAATATNQAPDRYSSGTTTIKTDVWKTSITATGQSETKPYVWNFERIEYTIDNPKDTEVTLLTSKPRAIKTITEYYMTKSDDTIPASPYFANSDTNHNSAPTIPDGWDTNKPSVSQGESLWNCEVVEYAAVDGNGKNLYEVVAAARIGYAGNNGVTPHVGENGNWWIGNHDTEIKAEGADAPKVVSEKKQFYLSTSDTSCAGGSWSDTPSGFAKGKYLWTRSVYTMDDDSTINGAGVLDRAYTNISSWCMANDTTLIDGAHIATGTIAAGSIDASTISTLNLVVGENVAMGANATISWNNVTDTGDVASKDEVATAQQNAINAASTDATQKANDAKSAAVSEIETKGYQTSDQVTTITRNEISTAKISANQVEVNGDLSAFNANIGGWSIGTDAITKGSVGMSAGRSSLESLVTANEGSPIRFYAGEEEDVARYEYMVIKAHNGLGEIEVTDYELDPNIVSVEVVSILCNGDEFINNLTSTRPKIILNYENGVISYLYFTFNVDQDHDTDFVDITLRCEYIDQDVKFRVLEDGSLYASAAKLGGEINATRGVFKNIEIENGVFGGLEIQEDGLFSENLALSSSGSIIASDLEVSNELFAKNMKVGRISSRNSSTLYLDLYKTSTTTTYTDVTATAKFEIISEGELNWLNNIKDEGKIKITLTSSKSLLNSSLFCVKVYYEGSSSDRNYYKYIYITIKAGQTIGSTTTARWVENSSGKPCSVKSVSCNTVIKQETGTNNVSYISSHGSFVPDNNGKYSLGTTDLRWKDIWCSQSSLNSSSDRNEKNSIEVLPEAYETFYDELQPVRYKFNVNDSNRYHVGLISQDVKSALDKAQISTYDFAGYLEYDKEDGSKGYGLRYGEFIALNIHEIQKLKKRVAELETKLSELSTQQND